VPTYDTPGHVLLDLEIPMGRIDIETEPGTTTEVTLEPLSDDPITRELIDSARIEHRTRGQGHEVTVLVTQPRGFFIYFGRGPSLHLRVRCPEGADVEVRTKSADVQARGTFGGFDAKTASGDIHVDEVGGNTRVKSASGDVAIQTTRGQADINTASGDLWIQRAHGPVRVALVSGDVHVVDAASSVSANTVSGDVLLGAVTEGSFELRSISGDIRVGVRRGSRVFVDANTVSGSTSSELELSDSPGAGGGEPEGPLVEIFGKTVSGDIGIERAAAPTPLAEPGER
jgi:DUF4097 and DUF4098 domain-containing protein YvlB